MVVYIRKWTVASVQVVYYIPDYLNLVNEFIWQTEDQLPEYPRITRFLDYWDKNIDGPIKEVYIYDHEEAKVRHVDRRLKIN
tara:strand:- start:1428 stop:1673 length:246 start_codon:yes stop_codon:yes gene_type:complete